MTRTEPTPPDEEPLVPTASHPSGRTLRRLGDTGALRRAVPLHLTEISLVVVLFATVLTAEVSLP